MRLAIISDTHGFEFKLEPADVFIHCGDIAAWGKTREYKPLADLLRASLYSQILLVPGNHDKHTQTKMEKVKAMFDDRVHFLIDQTIEIDGIKFYGSPWVLPCGDWYWMKGELGLAETYKLTMPREVDVVITHGPPFGILDISNITESVTVNDKELFIRKVGHAGSQSLMNAILERKVRHHFFGHIHANGGEERTLRDGDEATTFHNVAACNEGYEMKNGVKIIDLEPR